MPKKPLHEAVDEFLDTNQIYSFEGESGLCNLERMFGVLGYQRTGYRFGEVIEAFLADNPGACDAIVDWIKDQGLNDWRDRLVAATQSKEKPNA